MSVPLIQNYPAPAGAVLNADFLVKVRAPGGAWETVPCYRVKVDMHEVRAASMAYFDFQGEAEVEITCKQYLYQVDIRPLSLHIRPEHTESALFSSTVSFRLDRPANLSVEINKDRFHNLHLFAGALPAPAPDAGAANVLALPGNPARPSAHSGEELAQELEAMPKGRTLCFGPGVHYLGECTLRLPSDTNVYLAGGAVLVGSLICSHVQNVRIFGRGVVFLAGFERFTGLSGVRLSHSKHISIEGVTFINPPHYTVLLGECADVRIKGVKSFSCEGWSDGIDMMSCQDVSIEDVFLRTSDDCIAVYGHRWDYDGDTAHIRVQRAALWADVAHPIMIGTHGDAAHEGNVIEDVRFEDVDILEHHEFQPGYLGCMAINVGDKNTARDIEFRDIRVEPFEHGKLLDIQVRFNPDYNPAPGRRIENIRFVDVSYTGGGEETARICGYSGQFPVSGVRFENLTVRGRRVLCAGDGNIEVGPFAERVTFE